MWEWSETELLNSFADLACFWLQILVNSKTKSLRILIQWLFDRNKYFHSRSLTHSFQFIWNLSKIVSLFLLSFLSLLSKKMRKRKKERNRVVTKFSKDCYLSFDDNWWEESEKILVKFSEGSKNVLKHKHEYQRGKSDKRKGNNMWKTFP